MSEKNPLAYTGRVSGSTTVQGDVQFNSTDFTVANGIVSSAEAITATSITTTGDITSGGDIIMSSVKAYINLTFGTSNIRLFVTNGKFFGIYVSRESQETLLGETIQQTAQTMPTMKTIVFSVPLWTLW